MKRSFRNTLTLPILWTFEDIQTATSIEFSLNSVRNFDSIKGIDFFWNINPLKALW
jgi:hypothetical protein